MAKFCTLQNGEISYFVKWINPQNAEIRENSRNEKALYLHICVTRGATLRLMHQASRGAHRLAIILVYKNSHNKIIFLWTGP